MCVIALCTDKFPDPASLKSMEQLNGDGGGIAWVDNGKVYWEKGINSERMIKLIKKNIVKLPAIIHFRIGTIGPKSKELCHPFPLNENVPLDNVGTCEAVFFHNGHCHEWKELCLKAVISLHKPFPNGDFSDSRGIAWLVYHYGDTLLNLIEGRNKFAILTKDGIKTFGDGWTKHKDIAVSNDNFDRTYYVTDKEINNTNKSYKGSSMSYEDWKKYYGQTGIMVYEGNNYNDEITDGLDTLDDGDVIPTAEEILADNEFEKMIDNDFYPLNMYNGKKSEKYYLGYG